jgi:hypothetical protein
MSEYQEEVLTNILDLQAELRGDEPEPHEDKPPAQPGEETDPDHVVVKERGLTVAVSPSPSAPTVNERLAALNERIAQLEAELAGVTKRITRIEPTPEPADSESADVDAPWRSFLDLQKIVADRLDHG